jgi:hypothetical protein
MGNTRLVAAITTILISFIFTTPSLWGRIGESPSQCELRYGKSMNQDSGLTFYEKSGLTIGIAFYEGKADLIAYCRTEKDILGQAVKLSSNEIDFLLKSNSGGREWKSKNPLSVNPQWITEDGECWAHYDVLRNVLYIGTKSYLIRADAEARSKENQNLEGF